LNGCTQKDKTSNTTSNGLDSDNDGYPDNEDDYPTDSNLHEKITIISDSDTIKQNQGIGAFFDVDGDCKFVVVNWEVTNPGDVTVDEQHDIVFELMHPPDNISIDYPYDIANNRNLRFTIDSSNWGKWNYGFLNMGVISNVTIFREIYVLK
jgi:hypothetical protein